MDPNQQVLDQLIAQHGALVGRGAPDTDKTHYGSEAKQEDGSITDPYYSYFFADGAAVEMNWQGQVRASVPGRAPANNTPAEPNVSTTAKEIPEWNAQSRTYDWKPNRNYVPPKTDGPPQTVSPGEGVRQPDGTYKVEVPAKTAPGKTQAQYDQEATDAHAAAGRAAANSETPAQASARRKEEARSSANADADETFALWKKKVEAGYVMTPADEKELEAKIDGIKAKRDSTIRQEEAQTTYDRNQPNIQAGLDLQGRQVAATEQNAATSATQVEDNRINQERQVQLTQRTQEGDALKAQSTAGQSMLDSVIKAGSATPLSAATLRAVTHPLDAFFELAHQEVSAGNIPQSAIPTKRAPTPRTAPAPAVPRSAPAPAPYLLTGGQ